MSNSIIFNYPLIPATPWIPIQAAQQNQEVTLPKFSLDEEQHRQLVNSNASYTAQMEAIVYQVRNSATTLGNQQEAEVTIQTRAPQPSN